MFHYFNCVFLDLDNNENITILHVFNAAVECRVQLKEVSEFHGGKKKKGLIPVLTQTAWI